MNATNFSLEFPLNLFEIRKLNKMYFEHLFKERVILVSILILLLLIFLDLSNIDLETDFLVWLIRSLAVIVFFVIIENSFVDAISGIVFKLTKRLLKFKKLNNRYRFKFTNSKFCIQFPLGSLTHKWTTIEKAILTKNFLFLYIKEHNNYIITISRKDFDCRKMEDLLAFVENNVTQVIKI
ncbi:YcxB family protein [Flavobacterium tistrianum]|uniref:YcxB family protein n=1 Tax=Flavobacterium tistrianum TaxID=1685414 RepID=UPI0013A62C3A|nr:YcxB family protein [Flavobacterium tistrianum]KAF2340252.1 YcxB family protein [Flavobacterium tistrianum]